MPSDSTSSMTARISSSLEAPAPKRWYSSSLCGIRASIDVEVSAFFTVIRCVVTGHKTESRTRAACLASQAWRGRSEPPVIRLESRSEYARRLREEDRMLVVDVFIVFHAIFPGVTKSRAETVQKQVNSASVSQH